MREILFKGKKKDNGEWIEGYLLDGGMPGEKRIFIGKLIIGKWTVTADEFDEVDPDTICEYTGLTDKNGKKIWENDIVEAWSRSHREPAGLPPEIQHLHRNELDKVQICGQCHTAFDVRQVQSRQRGF